MSVKARGGLAVVQDPREAVAAGMPESAIQHVAVDHIVSLADLPPLLERLVAQPHGPEPTHLPGALTEMEGDEPGVACELVCPDCNGKLTVTEINGFQRFRCHVGHAYSLPAVAAAQDEHVEHAIWSAVRALEESARLAQRLAATSSRNLRAAVRGAGRVAGRAGPPHPQRAAGRADAGAGRAARPTRGGH